MSKVSNGSFGGDGKSNDAKCGKKKLLWAMTERMEVRKNPTDGDDVWCVALTQTVM